MQGLTTPPCGVPGFYAERRYHPPSAQEPSASARYRAAPTGQSVCLRTAFRSAARPIDAVKVTPHIDVEHSRSYRQQRWRGFSDCINRRPARPIPVGVLVEDRFQDGLQVTLDNLLGDLVRDRGNSQRPRFCLAVALWNVDPANRWRQITPPRTFGSRACRGVVRKCLPSKSATDCPISTPAASRLAFHFLEGLPDFPAPECYERLCLIHRSSSCCQLALSCG